MPLYASPGSCRTSTVLTEELMIGHPLKVRELLDEVSRGQVLLPEIQRAYVWKGPQVAKLISSLYHEYPVGSCSNTRM
jgi:uncharacterized protein with ParB-like and HNH nuclease domain